jgi:hypothetical protein
MCATDASTPPITHCLISRIDLQGQKVLTVDTTAGPVRLYVSGDINAGGQAGISHAGDPGRLGLFGNPISSDASCSSNPNFTNQTITLAGTSKPSKAAGLFAYFPCGKMGINGGAQATATCTPDGECGGGDIYGALWTKIWNGSASNQAQLVVPKDYWRISAPVSQSAFETMSRLASTAGADSRGSANEQQALANHEPPHGIHTG